MPRRFAGRRVPRALERVRPRKDRGATAVEYAIVAALIAGVIVLTVATLGTQVLALFQSAADAFP